jgi:hypothetical protein
MKRRVNRARRFMVNTCPASRHVHVIADQLAAKQRIGVEEVWDAEHIAGSLYSVLESLWKARLELIRLKGGWP